MSRLRLYLPILMVILATMMLLYSWPRTLLDFSMASFVVSFVYLMMTGTVGILAIKGRDETINADEFWAKVNKRTAILSYFFGTIWLALCIAWIWVDTTWGQRLRTFLFDFSKFMFP
ncbi:MAG: hypothetical protein UW46_C0001G0142 [Candidatus Yanofskybacteria bacterium GW2011_GWF1_44_227]|uniref:Uncharacterized protein n=1 Tax=Candidatus Yanofskybacteria bacterium GW2011_GWE2_40_11 TaxID=1619033 RepID=A0A0G0QM31_9BACT|nr:MAG: hypothetical protein UT69_C0013G0071 [Candidatus Yanofskybacteria bacterium GW2011_GWE1_40_10]KKR41168.1 MAG: hypothetical protein UT75_C0001G0072 [Candidatus Yanofskybacteria bacterium GW2011_GWE2_40_11]KKT15835.1 MAG: hypothetical protein UV97_C0001G0008 [Candidatus Yanofskybacteria bacterium GW2011_GWF2_43_596]KKT53652.1 MAG: hypothetical protein UW46_C0001G0142 [Candidatus Yanofskybacteria bacterium GW2011_GWF1_44_227]OGN36225.1 MAG: hypothetical protein A2241_00565 [Candidatus Yano